MQQRGAGGKREPTAGARGAAGSTPLQDSRAGEKSAGRALHPVSGSSLVSRWCVCLHKEK